MAQTLEEAFAHHCANMPDLASEARRIADNGGVHELVIRTQKTKSRGYVCELRSREMSEKQIVGRRLIDLT